MIPIPTNESISQMTLVQMTRYIIDLLTDYLPYAERVETAATGAENAPVRVFRLCFRTCCTAIRQSAFFYFL